MVFRVMSALAGQFRPHMVVIALALLALAAARGLPPATAAEAAPVPVAVGGTVSADGQARAGYRVTLYRTASHGWQAARSLGSAITGADGGFRIRAGLAPDPQAILYLIASRGRVVLATVLGPAPLVDSRVVVDERTTVATAFALARFIDGRDIRGYPPGIVNAAAMVQNLVLPRNGRLSPVLAKAPNGSETSTLRAFNTLANMIAACVADARRCRQLFLAARPPGGALPGDTLQAMVEIAHAPGRNVAALQAVAAAGPKPYAPALAKAPNAWTLALRFVGDGQTIDGPGAFAIDEQGSLWVTNNYAWSPPGGTSCAAQNLLRFTPTGAFFPGSPYGGGGLDGAGFGIAIAPDGRVWVSNFGFEAPACVGTPEEASHNSVSLFNAAGEALSPDATGYTAGKISWPQGTAADPAGNIWIANCGNDSVTLYPKGRPSAARNLGVDRLQLLKPFGVAIDPWGRAWVTGNGSDNVAIIGSAQGRIQVDQVRGGGIRRPMGIAGDSKGNMWVANSELVSVPCPGSLELRSEIGGSLTLIRSDGRVARRAPFTGGGIAIPWGLAIDGDDHVWVANFGSGAVEGGSPLSRIAELCGSDVATCPPGHRVGTPISPATGYTSDALGRITGIAVDSSGNLWAVDNWKFDAVQSNPGGYYVVAFLGIAEPVRTPLIGPPEDTSGRSRPVPRFPLRPPHGLSWLERDFWHR